MRVHVAHYTNLYRPVNANSCLTDEYAASHTRQMEFKDWLRLEIDARQLTEKQLEEITVQNGEAVPQATINRILTGKTPDPRVGTVAALMRAFGVELRELFKPTSMTNDRRLSAVTSAPFKDDEKTLLDGFRLADEVTRRHLLRMAADASADFKKRSGENNL